MSKFKEILTLLRSPSEGTQLLGLTQLCEVLSLSTEDHLHQFNSREYTDVLVLLLKTQTNPNIPLLAARSMTNMLEALPGSGQALMGEAVSELCSKLLSIHWMDLAEQCLMCLSALCSSPSNAAGVLRAGGLAAILKNADFFALSVRRIAHRTAANMVQRIPGGCFDTVLASVSDMLIVLQGDDDKCVGYALLFFSRVSTSFSQNYDINRLELLASEGLVSALLTILTNSIKDLSHSPDRIGHVLSIFLMFCESSAKLSGVLLNKGIVSILGSYSTQATGLHLSTLLSIGAHLLPQSKPTKYRVAQGRLEETRGKKVAFLNKNPELLIQIGRNFIPIFIRICNSSVDLSTQQKCLDGILRILDFADKKVLFDLLRDQSHGVCSFILTLLQSGDESFTRAALKITAVLMAKVSKMFKDVLIREGVVFAISKIPETDQKPPAKRTESKNPPTSRQSAPLNPLHPLRPAQTLSKPVGSSQKAVSLKTLSEKLLRKYFKKFESCESENVGALKKVCATLQTLVNEGDTQEIHLETLKELRRILIDPEVTTFEIVQSNLIPVLVQFLTFEEPQINYPANQRRILQNAMTNRHRYFVHVFLGLPLVDTEADPLELKIPEPQVWSPDDARPFKHLLKLLSLSLDTTENFPLHFVQVGSQSSGPLANVRMLSQPFRLKLVFDPSTLSKEERFGFDTRSVLIDSLGTCRSVRNYIMNELVHLKSPSTLLKDPSLRRQTRSMRNRAKERKLNHHPSSSSAASASNPPSTEDQYETSAPLEIAANVSAPILLRVTYNGNVIPDQMTMFEAIKRYHNQPTRQVAQPPTSRSTSTIMSLQARRQQQYNAIDIANVYNVDHEIVFDIQPKPLPNHTPSTRPIRPQAPQTTGTSSRSTKKRKLSKLRTVAPGSAWYGGRQSTVNDFARRSAGIVVDICKRQYNTRLRRRAKSEAEQQIETHPASSILVLLKFLHSLNTQWSLLYTGFYASYLSGTDLPKEGQPLVSAKLFHNKKLTRKMMKQLEDPLAVCSDSIPSWCADLMAYYHFLFPFETRRFYFHLAAFGRIRAFVTLDKHLKKEGLYGSDPPRAANSGYGSATAVESPENRLTHNKLKVRRSKVLITAIDHLKYRSTARGKLRVEFLGEVGAGIGQGPTLEFFTLVSHEIQRRDLALWQDESDDDMEQDDEDGDVLMSNSIVANLEKSKRGQKQNKKRKRKPENDDGERARKSARTSAPDSRKDTWVPILEATAPTQRINSFSFGHSHSESKELLFEFPEDFHRVAVAICTNCNLLQVPHCKKHAQLFTVHDENNWRCPGTDGDECKNSTADKTECEFCKNIMAVTHWCISDEEARYLDVAWPQDVSVLPTIALQCLHCLCINFPGNNKALCANRAGKITCMDGTTKTERSYRDVVRHLAKKCSKSELNQIPVIVTKQAAQFMYGYCKSTPYMKPEDLLLDVEPPQQEESSVEYVRCSSGIFPRPFCASKMVSGKQSEPKEPSVGESMEYFEFLGRLLAYALMDNCLLDIPFAQTFFKALLGERLSASDLLEVKYHVGKSLIKLDDVSNCWGQALKFHSLPTIKKMEDNSNFQVDGCPVGDLGLDFTAPGMEGVLLKPDGDKINVTHKTLRQYIDAVCQFFLVDGVQRQFAAIRKGFHEFCAVNLSRVCFSASELQDLVCGADSDRVPWDFSTATLLKCTKTDLGYTHQSSSVQDLFEILQEFTPEQQRQFVRFVTGCPRLPVGGLKNLHPRLTIIRIPVNPAPTPSTSSSVDCTVLPSAMTCTNYLKLPEYNNKNLMKQKLILAMQESQSGFLLS